jgi:hypothetical protein
MEQVLFIKEYYYYLIGLIAFLIFLTGLSYQKRDVLDFINIVVFLFACYTVYYLGSRDLSIGVDTLRYEQAFLFYQKSNEFIIRKDVFYDLLTFLFSKFLNFSQFLTFCSFLYVFGFWYGLKKIFNKYYYIPFLLFLISPYFISNGVSAIRSGVASSLFIFAIGTFYKTKNLKRAIVWMVIGILFHLSMFIPFLFFIISRYVNKTKIIFLCWLFSIVLGALNVNVIHVLVENLGVFEERIGDYAENVGERNFWINFAIFGFFPVVISIYNVLFLKYDNKFYTWILNSYMLIHIPYIMLLNSEYGLRLGYLAEFMMPILLVFPFLIETKMKFKYTRLDLSIVILLIFLLKAYKILVI